LKANCQRIRRKINDKIRELEETVAGTDKEAITTQLSELIVAASAINEVKQPTTEESAKPDVDDTVVDAEFTEKK
jgi:uncharacterized protein HemX